MDSRRSSQLWGINIKYLFMIALALQNSALILTMHYSIHSPAVAGRRYYPSTAVFLNEVIKLTISLTLALYDLSSGMSSSLPVTSLFKELARKVFTEDSWKLAIPALIYTLSNSLQYVAITNFKSAASFAATYQTKVLTTALFSVVILGRSLTIRQWLSLLLLAVGVATVQMPLEPDVPTLQDLKDEHPNFHFAAAHHNAKRSATYEGIDQDLAMQNPQLDASVGLTAVLGACILCALAGVYFEKVLKDANTTASVWVRNVQLSLYSLFPALFIGVIFIDGADVAKNGFFVGYSWIVWTTIALQALGGILVACLINHASVNAKGKATGFSTAATFLASAWSLKSGTTTSLMIGTFIILVATYLYNSEEVRPRPPPIVIADYEKTAVGNEPSYFDLPSAPLKSTKSPIRGEAMSTSRPNTPTYERRHVGGSTSKREA